MSIAESEAADFTSRVRRTEHAGKAYDADIAACRKALIERDGLYYVSHVTCGILDFAVETPDRWPNHDDTAEGFDRAGRQLSRAVDRLDTTCQPLDTGSLIRVVIQGNAGALFHFLKLAGQSFFGMTLEGSPDIVDQADRQMAQLAEAAARRLGAASLHWGAFQTREESGELWQMYEPATSVSGVTTPYTKAGDRLSLPGPVADICRAALHADHLHYVGIYHHGQATFTSDLFDQPLLAPFFQRVTPRSRRDGYARLIRQIQMQNRQFSQLLHVVHSSDLTRIVLDVARGAIYVLPFDQDAYLVGVTLIQSEVDHADQQMNILFNEIRPRLVSQPPVPADVPRNG